MNAEQFLMELAKLRANTSAGTRSLSDITLTGASLEGIDAAEFQFTNCDFSRCNFARSDFASAKFIGCRLLNTNFSHANLFDASFESAEDPCDLTRADLSHVDANPARFISANLSDVTAQYANFEGADFTGATLSRACLNYANLNEATAYVLDGCQTHFTEFKPGAEDGWSKLRRSYTGLKLFLHLIPVILFVLILVTKTLLLYGAAYMEVATSSSGSITGFCADPANSCEQVKLLAVVSGWDQGWFAFGFVMFSLLLNGGRFYVTLNVSSMRESEERSRRSPVLTQYNKFTTFAGIINCMVIVNLVWFALNLFSILMTTLLLPE